MAKNNTYFIYMIQGKRRILVITFFSERYLLFEIFRSQSVKTAGKLKKEFSFIVVYTISCKRFVYTDFL